jgi:hypothetical protein
MTMPAFVNDTIQIAREAVSFFTDTAAGRAIAAQAKAAEAEKRRQERVAQRAEAKTLEARKLAMIRAHQPKLTAAEAEIERRRAAVAAAESARVQLVIAHREAVEPLSRRLDRIAAELYQSRPTDALNAFTADMEQEQERTRLAVDSVTERCIDGQWRQQWSNRESVLARYEAISAAINKARALAETAIDDAELSPQLDALKASLPAVEDRPAK